MSKDLTIDRTPEAVESPLLIHGILESGVRSAPDQEIVYADQRRLTYRELEQRVHRLAGALAARASSPATPWRSWTGTRTATWKPSSPFP